MNANDSPTLGVNPDILRSARERVHLGAGEVVARAEKRLKQRGFEAFSLEDLANFESGVAKPTVEVAETLADILLLPFCALFNDDLPRPPVINFRLTDAGLQPALSYDTLTKLERFDSFYRLARELVRSTYSTEAAAVPTAPHGLLGDNDVIELVAERIRESIGLEWPRQQAWTDDTALNDLRDAVESTGTFVFMFSLNVDEVRGASKWEPGGPPAILVNNADSPAARLFTMMHEFAHLVVSRPQQAFVCDPGMPNRAAERIANRISAATLVPRSALLEIIDGHPPTRSYADWPYALRRKLKATFRVSHPVIGIRLRELGLVTDAGRTKSFWKHAGGRGRNTKTVAERYRGYLGARAVSMAAFAVSSGDFDPALGARLLGVTTKQFEQVIE